MIAIVVAVVIVSIAATARGLMTDGYRRVPTR